MGNPNEEDECPTASPTDTVEINYNELGVIGLMCAGGTWQVLVRVSLCMSWWFIEAVFLYYLYTSISPFNEGDEQAPILLVVVAIFVHVQTSFADVSNGIRVLMYTSRMNMAIVRVIAVFIDAFVIPFIVAVLGGVYLYFSSSVEDVILNATALTFVSKIDEECQRSLSLWSGAAYADSGADPFIRLPKNSCLGMGMVFLGVGFFPSIPLAIVGLVLYLGSVLEE